MIEMISWNEIKHLLRQNGNLVGCLYIMNGEVEGEVSASDSIIDIVDFHDAGGEFGRRS